MTRAIAVSSSAERPDEAVLDVAAQLRERGFSRSEARGAALVFASAHHARDPGALAGALSDMLGPLPYLGWVGASALHGMKLPEGQAGLSVLLLEDVHGYVRSARQEGLGALLAATLAADAPVGRARFVAAAAEGFEPRGFLGSLDEQGVPLAGGLCVSPSGGVASALAPGLEPPATGLLSLSGCHMLLAVAQGARPLGTTRRVSRAQGNLLHELDGLPAFEALLADLPPALRPQLPRLAGSLFCGLATDDGATFTMRNVVGVDPRAGVVAVAGEPREGSDIVFALRDARAARADLEETLHSLVTTLGDRRPLATVLFTCAARNEGLLGVPLYDVGRVDDLLGGPVVGVAAGGELCTFGAASHLFSHTAVVAVLLPDEA